MSDAGSVVIGSAVGFCGFEGEARERHDGGVILLDVAVYFDILRVLDPLGFPVGR